MSFVCHLCKNRNSFQFFVRYYQETFEKLQNNNSLNDPTKFIFVHFICSCFFVELDLEVLESKEISSNLDEKNLLTEIIVCNEKNLKENVMDDCSICMRPINGYYLIHCLVKYNINNTKIKYHLGVARISFTITALRIEKTYKE